MEQSPDLQEEISKNQPKISSKKKILLSRIFVFILIVVPLGIYFIKADVINTIGSQFKIITQPSQNAKITEQINSSKIINEQHGTLFYADLEYNPRSQETKEVDRGTSNGDLNPLSSSPASSSAMVSYKIVVESDKNELLLSGWTNLYKRVILGPTGNYRFTVSAPYYKNANVSVYTFDNKKIWQSKIQ